MKHDLEIKKLGEVAKFQGGSQPPKSTFVYEATEGYIRLLQIRDFKSDEKATFIPISSKNRICETDDVLIGRYGASVGKICTGKSGAYNVALIKALPNTEIMNIKYFINYLKSILFQKPLSSVSERSAQNGFNKHDISGFPIPIPPIDEQKRIVAKLDECFEAIDKARANVQKNLNNAKELFQSQLNQIFSQKGDGWVEKILDEIGETQTGTTPSTKDKSNYGDFIPFVKPPHFKPDGSIDAGNSMLSESGLKIGRLFPPNSVLMVCIGATIGKTGFTETAVSSNQQINCLTPNENYYPKLFYYGLISPFVQKQVADIGKGAQATLPIINKTKWQGLRINIPESKSEQIKIVKQLDDLKSQTQSLEANYQQELDALDELKKSILQKAFNGEL